MTTSFFAGVGASVAPTVGVFRASVDNETPNNISYLSASWAPLSAAPSYTFQSPFESTLIPPNPGGNVALSVDTDTITASGEVLRISAPISSSIHVLAIE